MDYDSTYDTLNHIRRVQELLFDVTNRLHERARVHDTSKLENPEKPIFDEVTPKLRDLTYGSDEYKACLAYMGKALQHHYQNNTHHPEHYGNGIQGMSLLDLIEMLIDWKAATERHANGDLYKSINQNQDRFGYPDALTDIFTNTAKELGWP